MTRIPGFLVRTCAIVAMAVAASGGTARAQRLFGTVVLADDQTPARGAIVTAIDSAGVSAGRELTTSRGDFVLPVSHAGRYTVSVLRIGSLAEIVRVVVEAGRDLRMR